MSFSDVPSVSPSVEDSAPPPALVARLRAAGCVFAEDEARLLTAAAADGADLEAMAARRCAGLPLEQVVGWAEFCGSRVVVEPGVFVPRRRSEYLVAQAVAVARAGAVVVDLCCGSGALGLAVAAAVPLGELHAVDVDPVAVRCARRNLAGRGTVYLGDLDGPLPRRLRGRVDVLVANVPYVPTGEIGLLPVEARLHEPQTALDGGADGLALVRRVAALAPGWLRAGGLVLVESSERQAAGAAGAMAACGLEPRIGTSEEHGATVVSGRWGGGGGDEERRPTGM